MYRINSFQVRGPFNAKGAERDAEPRPHLRAASRPSGATADGAGRRARRRSSPSLARRAYRRPVTAEDVAELFEYYEDGAKDGGFEGGVRSAVTGMLASPFFLYRGERVPGGRGARRHLRHQRSRAGVEAVVLPLEHDSRRRAAAAGRRRQAEASRRCSIGRCSRMLADPRSITLADNFVPQWLDMKRLDEIVPDSAVFPYASGRVGSARRLPHRADALRRQHLPRGPQRRRSAEGEPHLSQRARGAALRHHRREGRSLPPRRAGAVGALGPAGQGRRADGGGLSRTARRRCCAARSSSSTSRACRRPTRRPTCRRSTRRTSAPPRR